MVKKRRSIPTQPSFFRGYVSFREGTVMYSQYIEYLSPICLRTYRGLPDIRPVPTERPRGLKHPRTASASAEASCITRGLWIHGIHWLRFLLVVISNHTNWRDDDNWTPCGNSKWNDEKFKNPTYFVVLDWPGKSWIVQPTILKKLQQGNQFTISEDDNAVFAWISPFYRLGPRS